jgi:acyl-CoA synthetase (AMP-forming)/AMP-acid ligase II
MHRDRSSAFVNVEEYVAYQARERGASLAVVDGTRGLSYRELDRLVSQIASFLRGVGMEPGDHCAFLMDHSAECLAAFFGIQRAGLVVVPLNVRLRPAELEFQIHHADVKAVVVTPSMLASLEWAGGNPGSLVSIVVMGAGGSRPSCDVLGGRTLGSVDLIPFDPDAEPESSTHDRGPDDPCALWFTSGTTGRPKGVLHSGRSGVLASSSYVEMLGITAEERSLCQNTFHIGMMGGYVVPVIRAGGVLVMLHEFSVENILRCIQDHRVSGTGFPPAFLGLLDRDPTILDQYDISSLRHILIGASPTEPGLLARSIARFPDAVWVHAWGQTEVDTGGILCQGPDFMQRPSSVGRPMTCVDEVAIVDKTGAAAPAGEVGELCLRGPTVMLGYYRNPEATADTLRDGWLHTGDLACQDDEGFIYLKGREREVIIRGGENVYPAEVEAVLSQHPSVGEVAVVGIPDSVMTEVPVAFVALRASSAVTVEELLGFTSERLARYKCPVQLELVDELPRNSIGKVRKTDLADRARKYCR